VIALEPTLMINHTLFFFNNKILLKKEKYKEYLTRNPEKVQWILNPLNKTKELRR